eukprot:TRINITY_DN6234_c0_g1_i4.p1 TRINITY_DN6234_c0_g1~~TRINITY_DN6234_c0_g1_i4.p1  ORF type:complete len:806 (+),score=97.74 TRINITY_DN6234_c0_g1_i4:299-2716(+)
MEVFPPEEKASEVLEALKDDSEIERFTVDENLTDIERLTLFLESNEPLQEGYALENLSKMVRIHGPKTRQILQPSIKKLFDYKLDEEGRVMLAEAYQHIFRDRSALPEDVNAFIAPLVLQQIKKKNNSQFELKAWLGCFVEMVEFVNVDVLQKEAISLALQKGELDKNVESRVVCCTILGAAAKRLDKDVISKLYLRKALQMCQDTDYQVRLSMCQWLCCIAKTLGSDLASTSVLPELLELSSDEASQVRIRALESLIQMMDIVTSKEVICQRIFPVFRQHMQSKELGTEIQRCMARNFGVIMQKMGSQLEETDFQTFIGQFRFLASRQDLEVRQACAQNFSVVAKICGTYRFQLYLHETFVQLIADKMYEVRQMIAKGFNDVAKVLGQKNCIDNMIQPFITLLQDLQPEVKLEITRLLNSVLCRFNLQSSETAMEQIGLALVTLDDGSRNWRLQYNFVRAFSQFPKHFNWDLIYDLFYPIVLKFLQQGAMPVKEAAADGIAAFFRVAQKERHRTEIYLKIVKDFGRSKSFWNRLVYIDICQHLIHRFSTNFFKEYLLDLCLDLMYDSVPNIRIHVCTLLPQMKQTVKLPEDVDLLEKLNNAMSNLQTDDDREVQLAARAIHEAFKRMPVRMTGGAGVLDMNGMPGGQSDFEAEDRQKEEEESQFTMNLEEIEKARIEFEVQERRRNIKRPQSEQSNDKRNRHGHLGGGKWQGQNSGMPLANKKNAAATQNPQNQVEEGLGGLSLTSKSLGGSSFLGVGITSKHTKTTPKTGKNSGVSSSSASTRTVGSKNKSSRIQSANQKSKR